MRFKICAAIDKENTNDNFLITLRAGGYYCISRVVVVREMFVKDFFLKVAQKKGRTKRTHQIAGFETMM